ncbi:MAG: glycosyltransferase [Nitrospirae bacterium]|nr:glycosyltransferase [Nitrospirota bacterium]
MRILHILPGILGADSIFIDAHRALRKAGINSNILAACNGEHSALIKGPNEIIRLDLRRNKLGQAYFGLSQKIAQLIGLSHSPGLISAAFVRNVKQMDFDILHFNTARGTASYFAFPELSRTRPAVFTICSMWSFTGHCFHSLDCERWKTGCGKCPKPDIQPAIRRDATRLEWLLKKRAYRNSNLTIVTTSRWLTEQVRHSILNRFPIYQIPHGIDTETYKPLDKEQCRAELGIHPGKKVLLFVADRLNDRLKGGDILIRALNGLPRSLKAEILLLVMGRGDETISQCLEVPTLTLGYIGEHKKKAACFSAADLLLFPTRAETLGLVSIESQACGTPVVSFRVGGVTDHVRHGITGYLAEPESAEDFRNGILRLLKESALHESMAGNCRENAVTGYDINLWVRRFTRMCESIIH